MTLVTKSLSPTEFRMLSVKRLRWFLKKYKMSLEDDGNFVKREPTPLLSYETFDNVIQSIGKLVEEIDKLEPKIPNFKPTITSLSQSFESSAETFSLASTYYKVLKIETEALDILDPGRTDAVKIEVSSNFVNVTIAESEDNDFVNSVRCSEAESAAFLLEVMRLFESNREKKRAMTPEETSAVEAAQLSAISGFKIPNYFQGLGVAGFREIQTYLSIADPGEGHESVTAQYSELLEGVVVHVEHIDRDKNADKSIVEPYRLPAAINGIKVRIAVANEAPVTAFIGRPMFENFDSKMQLDPHFDLDLLKTSHFTASACSTMFMIGMADCKIGIERMKVDEAIAFMKAVVGNVIRDEDQQYLSAAFNINTPIQEDSGVISKPFEIALKGIQIAVEGGFDKVTWDGASNQIPSIPIIDQLSHEEFVTLVHSAHEQGLETYISAGLQPNHMARCVYLGVDGVGIGTSLHYKDPVTKLMGALKPSAIREVLDKRDQAAVSTLGQGAKLLARMDREFFEGIISTQNEQLRKQLFDAVKAQDEAAINQITDSYYQNYEAPPTDSKIHPLLSRAHRLLTSKSSLMEQSLGPMEFEALQCEISTAIKSSDFAKIRSCLKNG